MYLYFCRLPTKLPGVSHVRNIHDALAITVQAPPSVQGLSPSQHPPPHPCNPRIVTSGGQDWIPIQTCSL